ncbi:MAG: hypothetical protein ACPLXS_03015, partial [Candidatus Micrarchaeales archaeon]
MVFEKSIREDFSKIQVLFFIGGKGERMKNLAYKQILPSKSWLPISTETEPLPLFWRNFEILLEFGFKEFYFLTTEDGEKIKKYFKTRTKNLKIDANVQLFKKEDIPYIKKEEEKVNICIFENKGETTGEDILALKNILTSPFLIVFGDEYYGGEKEKI